MPLSEYKCTDCNKVTEELVQHNEPEPTECTECKGPLTKLVSLSGFKLNCMGFYATDYGGKASR